VFENVKTVKKMIKECGDNSKRGKTGKESGVLRYQKEGKGFLCNPSDIFPFSFLNPLILLSLFIFFL
jgi:hypothetical protein